ncbi:zinc-binding dehydrogenase [Bradyrhizobium sp. NP1]|uniref:zinc-binding dehydrogenase n=1 Tax=Bradyrhizobium sp. NP1 TaxID=3049772 RepID=UPI0025A52F5E|nr:zinc-binding dehydrogenase [Bradyrhizobium sp. NP1]WJR79146.1 zinc-binding dehydrogenase [Bradyrhizobium sp. NP1]
MKAAVIEAHGGVENIVYREFPDPEVRPGDVLVRVKACGLNHFDIFVRRGIPGLPVKLPFISGGDIAGTVAAVGAGVEGFEIGDAVLVDPMTDEGMVGEEVQGGMAELVRVQHQFVISLDRRLSFERAACVPANFGTANRMLHANGGLQKDDLLLVLGASGGVGTATVQLARAHGARVIACAGSDEKCARLQQLGADYTINYSREDFSRQAWAISGKKGVDVCVNFTGGETWVPSLRALKRYGKLLTCGATAGFDPREDIRYIWQRELRIIGSNGYLKEDVEQGMRGVAEGRLALPEIRTFPMSKLAEAESLMEARDFFGKIVLIPD